MIHEQCKTCQKRTDTIDSDCLIDDMCNNRSHKLFHEIVMVRESPETWNPCPEFVGRSCATCAKECGFEESESVCKTNNNGDRRSVDGQRERQERTHSHVCGGCGARFEKWAPAVEKEDDPTVDYTGLDGFGVCNKCRFSGGLFSCGEEKEKAGLPRGGCDGMRHWRPIEEAAEEKPEKAKPADVKCKSCKHVKDIHHHSRNGGMYHGTCLKDTCVHDINVERECADYVYKYCDSCKHSGANNGGLTRCPDGMLNGHACYRIDPPGLWKWEAVTVEKEDEPGARTCRECGFLDGVLCYYNKTSPFKPTELAGCIEYFKPPRDFDGSDSCDKCKYNYDENGDVTGCNRRRREIGVDDGHCFSGKPFWMPIVKPAHVEKKEPYTGKVPEKYWSLDYKNCPEVEVWRAARWRFTKGKEKHFTFLGAHGDRYSDVLPCYFHDRSFEDCYRCAWGKLMGKCGDGKSTWKKIANNDDYTGVFEKIDAKIAELEAGTVEDPEWKWTRPECEGCMHCTPDNEVYHDEGRFGNPDYITCKKSSATIKSMKLFYYTDEKPCVNREEKEWKYIADCTDCVNWEKDFKVYEICVNCPREGDNEWTVKSNEQICSIKDDCKYYKKAVPTWAWIAGCTDCKHWNDNGPVENLIFEEENQVKRCSISKPIKCTREWKFDRPCSKYKKEWAWVAPNACDGCKHYTDDNKIETRGSGKRFMRCNCIGSLDYGFIIKADWNYTFRNVGITCSKYERAWAWEADCKDCMNWLDNNLLNSTEAMCSEGITIKCNTDAYTKMERPCPRYKKKWAYTAVEHAAVFKWFMICPYCIEKIELKGTEQVEHNCKGLNDKKEETKMENDKKCRNCGVAEDRDATYCPECGKVYKKIGVIDKVKNWLLARRERKRDAEVEGLKTKIVNLQNFKEEAILEINKLEMDVGALENQVGRHLKKIDELVADRDANYIALDKKLVNERLYSSSKIKFKIEGPDSDGRYTLSMSSFDSNKLLDPTRLILFYEDDLPKPEDD